jgi:two-component system, chemotaxis family, chemotaxis protein CheY
MNKISVLIVEDNLDSRQLLQMMLESEGFIVAAASDGRKAMEMLHEIKPDVLVTDLMLPAVSGGELIRHVRGTDALTQIPIVVVSAYSDHYEADALEAGANVVLKKPLDGDLLIRTVKRLKEEGCGAREEG